MNSISSRSLLVAAVSPLAMIVAATPAWGQDAQTAAAATTQPAPETSANPQDTNAQPTIVITGFRASLRSATAKKKNSESVVESVSAEDIGKLPDNGIGESIARLPGLAAQRDHGRA